MEGLYDRRVVGHGGCGLSCHFCNSNQARVKSCDVGNVVGPRGPPDTTLLDTDPKS